MLLRMNNSMLNWIEVGYKQFASQGEQGINIEALARKVGISKSSFYHHFDSVDGFIKHLLQYHLQQAKIMAAKEQQAANINPMLINILIAHKFDLLFNRQLRIHKANADFANVLEQSNQITGAAFIQVWVKDLNLTLSELQIEGIFELALENFFLQINESNITQQWLTNYFNNLKKITLRFQ
jgi:AcrR family transcriptional regulator